MSRVLVAEDSGSIRLLIRRRLELAGHEVAEARDGQETLRMLEAGPLEKLPDLVLLDAMMPRLDGAETLRRIKGGQPRLPVIAVSAIWDLGSRDERSAADGHMTKPIDFGELLARIDALSGAQPRPGSPTP
jgi:two-component system, HptB-dependent secretion and biofilm response regulator